MVVRVTPVRAEIVCFKRRAEDCPPYLALQHFSALKRVDVLSAVQFRQLAPEFAFAFSQLFWDVDLTDNVEIAAFP